LILRKIIKVDATHQMSDFKAKRTNFRWGSAPDPAGGAYSAPPDLLAVFKGPTCKGKEGEEWEKREGRRRGTEEEGSDPPPKIFGLEPALARAE